MSVKSNRRLRIKAHIRHNVSVQLKKPRLTVYRSNAQIYAQVIDDVKGATLASASSLGIKEKMTKTEQAAKVVHLWLKLLRKPYHCRGILIVRVICIMVS
jgi:large subunit ribosomal protein L18